MKIGLVLHPFDEKQPAGLGKAIFSLAKHIIENDLDVDNHYTIFVKGVPSKRPDIEKNNWKLVSLPKHIFWLDVGLLQSEKQDVCVFFTPFMPIMYTPKKSLVVVHDLSYKEIPATSTFQSLQRLILSIIHGRSLRRALHVIAISSYTKSEVIRYYGKKLAPRISVVHNGFDSKKVVEKFVSEKKHVLFVGVLKARKNVINLVRAYCKAQKMDGSIPPLVLVGKGGGEYLEAVRREIALSTRPQDISIKGYVSDAELSELFSQSVAFVFPSLIEGFGLPVLEAMDVGVPVLTSNRGALKEVSGDAAILVNPEDINELAEGIVRLCNDKDLQNHLVEKGKKRVLDFSWKKTAQKYINIIKSL